MGRVLCRRRYDSGKAGLVNERRAFLQPFLKDSQRADIYYDLATGSTESLVSFLEAGGQLDDDLRRFLIALLKGESPLGYKFVLKYTLGRPGVSTPATLRATEENRRKAVLEFLLAGGFEEGGYEAALAHVSQSGFSRGLIQKVLSGKTLVLGRTSYKQLQALGFSIEDACYYTALAVAFASTEPEFFKPTPSNNS